MLLFLKNLLFTLVFPGTVAVYVPFLLVHSLRPGAIFWRWMSLPVFAAGAGIYLWCVWDFASFGRGTPAPIDAPRRLVVRGLYRYTRNPMYVGVLTTILGWAVRYRSTTLVLYAGAVGLCFHAFIAFYEEPHLERIFGPAYAAYRANVGRWLPRLKRR
jgi:protein-S-isoprenylcysteine O-methyltransferase Ste14